MKKDNIYSSLLILGAGILLFRTIRLLTVENGWNRLAGWVIVLTFTEMAIDALCIIYSFRWQLKHSNPSRSISLRLGATAAIFHAFRVLIYVIGRVGPWYNFDLRSEFRSNRNADMFWVYFAAILSVLGILGVIIIYLLIKRSKRKNV